MKVHSLTQGSAEWLAYRHSHFNASDAPAMMGCSPQKNRTQLLRELHSTVVPEVHPILQKVYDAGHRLEALARPLAEEFIGQELYPCVGSVGKLSASFDGLTLDESIGFEHKQLSGDLRAAFRNIATIAPQHQDRAAAKSLPLMHQVQVQQQIMVSGAARVLFMASDWDADGGLIEEQHCWCYPDPALQAQITDGWYQFELDLAGYVLPDATEPAAVGKAPDTLPALRIEVTGMVTASNLAEFKQTALAAIRSVNRTLTTDQHFADADKAVKWCGEVESRLKAAKEHALSQTADIDALFKALDDIGAEARTVRLDLSKLVDRRKTEVKEDAVTKARRALDQHVATLNAEIAPMRVPQPVADFAGAIKGLKSIDSMQAKLDQTLTVAKIAADADARAIRANLFAFKAKAAGFEFLFADLGQVVHKAEDDFCALIDSRIAAHKAAEAERERKRVEAEQARIAAEAQRLAAEATRQIEEATRQAAAVAAPPPFVPPLTPIVSQTAASVPPKAAIVSRPDEPATLKLGTICDRLGIVMTAAFVTDKLRLPPARTEGAAKLYRESDFGRICAALQQHIERVYEAQREAVAA